MKYIWQNPKWPHFTWNISMLAGQLGRARLAQGELIGKIKQLGFDTNLEAVSDILVEEAIKTSAVEGAKLDDKAVRSSVARHLGLPFVGHPLPERHIDGLIDVLLDATTNYSDPLTAVRLKGWQAALFPTGYSGLHKIEVGSWRGGEPMKVVSGPLGREKIHYEAPPHDVVGKEMKEFLVWWKESRKKIDGLIRAGVAHFYFVTIHPFEDGNGRIARAVTDMALAQDDCRSQRLYSMSSQIMAERDVYYNVLESTQKGDLDITDWLLWFLGCAERAIKRSEKITANVLAKADFWRKNSDKVVSEKQKKVINRLLDAGKDGFEEGLTTRKYVSIAHVSRASAYREITDLVEKGLIKKNEGSGRNVSYSVVL